MAEMIDSVVVLLILLTSLQVFVQVCIAIYSDKMHFCLASKVSPLLELLLLILLFLHTGLPVNNTNVCVCVAGPLNLDG